MSYNLFIDDVRVPYLTIKPFCFGNFKGSSAYSYTNF